MSIHDEVNARCKEGRLVRLSGLLPGRPEVRTAFVAPAIWNLLFQGPWKGGADEEDRWIKVTAWFAWFIEGGTLVLPREERHHRGAHMLRLRREVRQPPPKEVWEARITDPDPGIRLFGRFAGRDRFIALTSYDRIELGDPYTDWTARKAWWAAGQTCQAHWVNLFGPYPPLEGNYPDDYLTNAQCH